MKIGIAQFNPRIGDIVHNTELILSYIQNAKKANCALVVFPELSITGYPPRDLLDYSHIIDENIVALEKIGSHSDGITVVCGYVERNSSKHGKSFYNSVAVFHQGKKIANYRKRLLPYYDVFEDERHFEPGAQGAVFELDGKKIGLTICEDLWNETGFIKNTYSADLLADYHQQKIDILINSSASPFNLGKPFVRQELVKAVASKLNASVIYCTQVGANDELIFDGGSLFVDPKGTLIQGKFFEEDLLVVDTQKPAHSSSPLQTEEAYWLCEALVLGIKDYVAKSNAKGVCVGLSGGIDSSVVVALAVRALGKERVSGVALPSEFTSEASNVDAEVLAKNLEISFKSIAISPMFQAFKRSLELQGTLKELTQENIQPRIRMTLLMAICNEENRLLLNTSNKSEICVGYATQYGDTAGALAVLGDLTKKQVYDLAGFLNRSREVIPKRVIDRAPSAELKPNQTDQDTLAPYDHLDRMVKAHIEDGMSPERLRQIYPEKMASDFLGMASGSEYKRRQLPPALRVSTKSFGSGRRIPVVGRKPSE